MGPNEEFREARPDWRLVDLCVVRSWGVDRPVVLDGSRFDQYGSRF